MYYYILLYYMYYILYYIILYYIILYYIILYVSRKMGRYACLYVCPLAYKNPSRAEWDVLKFFILESC